MGILSTEGTLVGRSSLRKTELIHSFERKTPIRKKSLTFFFFFFFFVFFFFVFLFFAVKS